MRCFRTGSQSYPHNDSLGACQIREPQGLADFRRCASCKKRRFTVVQHLAFGVRPPPFRVEAKFDRSRGLRTKTVQDIRQTEGSYREQVSNQQPLAILLGDDNRFE
jgi:hypothetical protein